MKFTHKFGYIALGGVLMLIGMMASSVLMPSLIAQRDKFGEIECTGLRVVDGEGNLVAKLGINDKFGGGQLIVYCGKSGKFKGLVDITAIYPFGGGIDLYGYSGERSHIGANRIIMHGRDEEDLHTYLYAGGLSVEKWQEWNLDDIDNPTYVGFGGRATMQINAHGGLLQLEGKSDGKVTIGINEYGNGAISTYDKNGYRQ